MELLYPTISLPVTVALFDLGEPMIPDDDENSDENRGEQTVDEGGDENGIPVSADEQPYP